jgi:hypothetical protein
VGVGTDDYRNSLLRDYGGYRRPSGGSLPCLRENLCGNGANTGLQMFAAVEVALEGSHPIVKVSKKMKRIIGALRVKATALGIGWVISTRKKGRLRCHKRPKSREETPKKGSDSVGGRGSLPHTLSKMIVISGSIERT